jgi:hypothetical protein
MLWWYEREGLKTRIEVLQLSSGEYELSISDSDGGERVEEFRNAAELAKRHQQVQDWLSAQGWKGTTSWIA